MVGDGWGSNLKITVLFLSGCELTPFREAAVGGLRPDQTDLFQCIADMNTLSRFTGKACALGHTCVMEDVVAPGSHACLAPSSRS